MSAPGLGKRKPRIRRSWDLASAKIAAEESRCRVCGTRFGIERAHIIGREHDATEPINAEYWQPYVVAPDRVIPLCGPATDPRTCHGKQHARRLDLLPYLTVAEQVQAVADADGISRALDLLMPSESLKRIGGPGWPE